jgi:hypothetical protein
MCMRAYGRRVSVVDVRMFRACARGERLLGVINIKLRGNSGGSPKRMPAAHCPGPGPTMDGPSNGTCPSSNRWMGPQFVLEN